MVANIHSIQKWHSNTARFSY